MTKEIQHLVLVALAILWTGVRTASAQSFGVELHNTLMPASGAMGGASLAQPQDLVSALNGNPATLTQFQGTQFTFSGSWAEPTFNLTQSTPIPMMGPTFIDPFAAKSTAQGAAAGNIGVTQDLSIYDLPVTFGVAFVTIAGGSVDFRHVPASQGTNSSSVIFSLPMAVGANLTENLSIGASMSLGVAFFDGPFVGAGGMTNDYALRASLGTHYQATEFTGLGFYYQTKQSFQFDNALILNPGLMQTSLNVQMDLPQNFGLGISNTRLMDGNLLLAADLLFKGWNDADLFQSIYDDQWVVQIGAQYTAGRVKLRAGYAWAENPVSANVVNNIGGVVHPGGLPIARYTQGLLAITSQHRISGGVGITDVLPGMDFDLMAGGMFRDTEQLGPSTTTSIASYWVGMGFTWHFFRS